MSVSAVRACAGAGIVPRRPRRTAWLALVAAACGGSPPPPPAPTTEGPVRIVADRESLGLQLSRPGIINYRLLDERAMPIPQRIIQFAIVDDPSTAADEARGSTLSYDRAVTDNNGAATLQVIAGPTPTAFRVRASAARAADVDVPVMVDVVPFAPVELAPVLADTPPPGMDITTVRLHLLDGITCAEVHYQDLPVKARTTGADTVLLYSSVNTALHHAAIAIGLDAAGVVRAAGCVDLPGSLLVVDTAVRVMVPMHFLQLGAAGRYQAISHLRFRAPPPGAMMIAEAWGDLSRCPQDPARLWLDCTVDALRTDGSDPSDCHPGDDEGPLGAKLNQRRGVPLPAPASGRCRDKVDAAGRPSHEALVDGLFPTQRPPILAGLPAVAVEASQLIDQFDLQSMLIIAPTSTPQRYQIDHRLTSVDFPNAARPTVVDLRQMGAPVIDARFVAGTNHGNDLQVGSHAFTLRMGTAAWLAFAGASLRSRGAGNDVPTFTNALFGLASRDDHGTPVTGCVALDALLCPDVGEARGCLAAACTEGLAALGRRLQAGFDALDGDDLDLVLGGSVPVLDRDGDGRTDALGMTGTAPGLWSGEVRGRGGVSAFSGTWTAGLAP